MWIRLWMFWIQFWSRFQYFYIFYLFILLAKIYILVFKCASLKSKYFSDKVTFLSLRILLSSSKICSLLDDCQNSQLFGLVRFYNNIRTRLFNHINSFVNRHKYLKKWMWIQLKFLKKILMPNHIWLWL